MGDFTKEIELFKETPCRAWDLKEPVNTYTGPPLLFPRLRGPCTQPLTSPTP